MKITDEIIHSVINEQKLFHLLSIIPSCAKSSKNDIERQRRKLILRKNTTIDNNPSYQYMFQSSNECKKYSLAILLNPIL